MRIALRIAVLLALMEHPTAPADHRPAQVSSEGRLTYFDTDFENGSLDPFRPAHCDVGCAKPRITDEVSHSGRHSVRMETTSARGWASRLEFIWCNPAPPNRSELMPCNPALSDPGGLYQRFYLMLPQSTIDRVVAGEQLKILLNRYNIGGRFRGGWWQTGFGRTAGSVPRNDLRTFEDAGFDQGTNVSTGVRLQGGVWYKIETWYRRDPQKRKGKAVLWINGKKVADSGWLAGMGRDEPDAQQYSWIGLVYARTTEPLVMYVDDVAAANHRLE